MTHAVGPQYLLEAGDLLYFCGELEQAHFYAKAYLLELITQESSTTHFRGSQDLAALEDGVAPKGITQSSKIIQATVKKTADIIGQTVGQIDFRKRFDVAVLGLKRGEAHQIGRISDMTVAPGDVLVLLGESGEVLLKPQFKEIFKDVEHLDEGLEKEYLTGTNLNKIFLSFNRCMYGLWSWILTWSDHRRYESDEQVQGRG